MLSKDGKKAFKWYQKAAKQGHRRCKQDSPGPLVYEDMDMEAGAQNSLSFLYDELEFEREIEIDMYSGMGVETDSAKQRSGTGKLQSKVLIQRSTI